MAALAMQVVFVVFVVARLAFVYGHGRLIDPPARASMWRLGFNTPVHYTDQELFCGGYRRQWSVNGGRCGECGDPWDLPRPRPNEGGGIWGTGTLGRVYHQGDIVTATVHLTANHMGWFEFRLCSNNNPKQYVKQSCLNKNVLKLVDYPGTRFHLKHSGTGLYRIRLQLPKKLSCSQCVLQWHYTTGNNWGFCEDGSNQPGCGPQEIFRGCSDIAVFGENDQTYYKYLNLTMEADLDQYLLLNPEDDRREVETRAPLSNDLDTSVIISAIPKIQKPKLPSITFVDDIKTSRQPAFRKKPILDQVKISDPDYFSERQKIIKSTSRKYVSSDIFRETQNTKDNGKYVSSDIIRKTQNTIDHGIPISAASPFLAPGSSIHKGPIVYNPYALGITPSPLGPPLLLPPSTKLDQMKPKLLRNQQTALARFKPQHVSRALPTRAPSIPAVSELVSDKLIIGVPLIPSSSPVASIHLLNSRSPSHFTIKVPMSALNNQVSLQQLMQLLQNFSA